MIVRVVIFLAACLLAGADALPLCAAEKAESKYDLSHADATAKLEDPNDPRADLAVYTFIVFALTLAVLWKFAWKPICDGLARREQMIASRIAEAQQSAEQAQEKLAQYQAQLARASDEVRQLLEQGRRDAEAQRQAVLAEAQHAARQERDRALREIEAARRQAVAELARNSVDTAIELAGRIVGERLTPSDHQRLLREALEGLPSKN